MAEEHQEEGNSNKHEQGEVLEEEEADDSKVQPTERKT
jgi:hypothetical protein